MEWELVLALILTVPVAMFPMALVWYFVFGGTFYALRRRREYRQLIRIRDHYHK